MKIVIVVGTFPALSETFVLDQIVGLINAGHDISIFAFTPPPEKKTHEAVQKYRLHERCRYWGPVRRSRLSLIWAAIRGLLARRSLEANRNLLGTLNFIRYGFEALTFRLFFAALAIDKCVSEADLLLCHHGPNGLLMAKLKAAGLIAGKIVTVFHGSDLTSFLIRRGQNTYQELFRQGALFLPISDRLKETLRTIGAPMEKIHVHHMGIDCSHFEFVPRGSNSARPARIISVARLVEKKGIEYALLAFARVHAALPNIEYEIIGDGPLAKKLAALISENGLSDCVRMNGWMDRDEVMTRLRNSDILLAPSVTGVNGDQEGIPVAIMEAMAIGLPVISTQHGGIPEIITNNISGYLVRERDVDALAEAILDACRERNDLSRVSEAGRAVIVNEFDNRALNEKLCSILQSVHDRM